MLPRTILLGFLAFAGALACAATSESPNARILILYDEDKDGLPGLAQIDLSLRESLRSGLGRGIEILDETLALSQFERKDYDVLAADYYRGKYAGRKLDLVVAVMEPSLDFLVKHGEAIFPGVPIVFCGVDASTFRDKKLRPNMTGVLVKRMFSPTLELALRLQPGTRNVYVVGGTSTFDRQLEAMVRRDLQHFQGRVAIEYLFDQSMDEWLNRLAKLPAHSVILYSTVFIDGAGRRFVPHEAVTSIAAAANAPVYVFVDQFVGMGPVGGSVYSLGRHGADAAALGIQVIRGAPPSSLPIREVGAQVDLFDARQLQRWSLDPGRLPAGSVVLHEERSAWTLYRWYLIAACSVLLLQAALIAGLLLARRQHRQAEAEARRQRDDLAHVLRVTTMDELSSSVAHELNQPLAAIQMNAQAAKHHLGVGTPADARVADAALDDIVASADHAANVIDRLRALFKKEQVEPVDVDLKELIDESVGLLRAAMLVERIAIRVFVEDSIPSVVGDPVQLEQVLLNVMRNAADAIRARPEGRRVITIRVRQGRENHLAIEVSDTGIGAGEAGLDRMFEHFVTSKPHGLGMGLAISRSIVEAHGGRIWATANRGNGLTLHIELPCPRERRVPVSPQERPHLREQLPPRPLEVEPVGPPVDPHQALREG